MAASAATSCTISAMAETFPVTLVLPDGKEMTLEVAPDAFIFDAAAAAGVDLPHTCLQGWCLNCAARIVSGAAQCTDNSGALRYYPEDAEGGYVLLCTARPRAACRLLTHQSQAMKEYRRQRGLPAPRG